MIEVEVVDETGDEKKDAIAAGFAEEEHALHERSPR
jgi:hypothetical protein